MTLKGVVWVTEWVTVRLKSERRKEECGQAASLTNVQRASISIGKPLNLVHLKEH